MRTSGKAKCIPTCYTRYGLAFGGNIVATIINPDNRPQMATVREGVMKKEIYSDTHKGESVHLDMANMFRTLILSWR